MNIELTVVEKAFEELMNVKGIGEKSFPKLKTAHHRRRQQSRPGSRILALVVVADQTVTIPAVVLRCSVWAVDSEVVTYRLGARRILADQLGTRARRSR